MFTTQTQNLKDSAQEACKANFKEIGVGTRVYCILYGGHFGTVVKDTEKPHRRQSERY